MYRVVSRQLQLRRAPVTAAALAASLSALLAGCSSMDSFSMFGSSKSSTDASSASASAAPPAVDFECPTIGIRQGAGTYALSAATADQTAVMTTRYQVGIGQTARECRQVGTTVTMKIGVQGRVVLGPAGTPGELDVPLRFAVIKEGVEPKTIMTKLQRIHVTIPSGDTNVAFTHVEEEVSFPMPKDAGDIDSYVVYIGFDPMGAKEFERKRPAKPAAKPKRQS
jgi:hypothetical protein